MAAPCHANDGHLQYVLKVYRLIINQWGQLDSIRLDSIKDMFNCHDSSLRNTFLSYMIKYSENATTTTYIYVVPIGIVEIYTQSISYILDSHQ